MTTSWSVRALAALLTLSSPALVEAQAGRIGSRLLWTDSWTYEAIERLRSRGYLGGLDPLVQPYRRIDVAAELVDVAWEELAEPAATWVRLLRSELTPELARLDGAEGERMGLEIVAGARAADSRRRDPLIPYRSDDDEGTSDRFWYYQGAGLWLETHNVAAEARLFKDRWTRDVHGDPDGDNPGGFRFVGRSDKAYLTMAFPWGDLWIGRLARNWGPLGSLGLMIGHNPTTYPQVGLDLGRGRFSFRFMAGELEPLEGRKRYLVGNRLDFGAGDFWVSVGESVLYSGTGSTLRLINPLEVLFFDHGANNDRTDITGNVMINAMFWGRVGRGTFYGEFVLDDFDLKPRVGADDREIEATSYHALLGARYLVASDRVELGLDYRRVSAWSYRSGVGAERWTHLERGLGDPWSDYDRLTLRADLFPSIQGLRVAPVLQVQRKGEGDYRIPFPEREEQLGMPGIFHGVVERTTRMAVQGRYQPMREVFFEWDVGVSSISNADHVSGASERRLSFLAHAGFTFTWLKATSGEG